MKSNQIRQIESPDNKLFKTWKALLQSQGVNKFGQFLISGEKLVAEALASDRLHLTALIKIESQPTPERLPNNLPIYHLKTGLFKTLDEVGTNSPILVADVPLIQDWEAKNPTGLEVFLALQDPGNLGGAIRTAVAFGASKVVVLKEAAHPFSPKALKAAAGANIHIPIEWGPSIQELRSNQNFYVLDGSGVDIATFQWPKGIRLLLGEEGRGVPDHLKISSHTLSVAISEKVESLNAGVALGVAMYQWKVKLQAT